MVQDFPQLQTLVQQNIFLSPQAKETILRDWDTFEGAKQQQLYGQLEEAYEKQTKAFEAALHKNPNFLRDIRQSKGTAQKEKLKVIEKRAFQEAEKDSAAILEELDQL